MTTAMHEDMRLECLRNCTECHNVCLEMSVQPQVVTKLGADDVKLLLNCAEMCATCADFLDTNSPYHPLICGTCSTICDACTQMCERSGLDVLRSCATTCSTCADSCRRMAAM